jgi:hypothetical protein
MGIPLSTTTWTSLGPAPVNNGGTSLLASGRIEGVAPHPTISGRFFVAGQNGGIWSTDNGGTSWTPLTDSQPSLEFNGSHNLAFSPANADIIIGAVGSPRGGMLISQDGGVTWQHQPIAGPGDDPQGIVFDPALNQTLYCANGWNGLYKSTDLGANWTQLTLPGGYFADVLMMPSGTLYTIVLGAANAAQNGIYYSIDGGAQWTQSAASALPSGAALGGGSGGRLAGGTHHYLTFVGKTEYVYASFLTVDANGSTTAKQRFVTDSGGAQWTALAASPGNFEGRTWHHTIATAPLSPNIVVANDAYSLFISFDYGQTWTGAGPGWDWVNLAFGFDGNVYATADQGVMSIALETQQYASMVGNLAVTQFYTIAVDTVTPSNVYGVAQDISTVHAAGTVSWSSLPGGEAGKLLVDFTDSANLYAYNTTCASIPGCSGYDLVIRSTNQGQSWTTILDGSNAGTRCASVLASGGNLYTSTQRSFAMDPSDAKRLAVGTTQVFVTGNALAATPTWSALGGVLSTDSTGTDRWIQSLAIAKSAPSVLFAATDDGHVWMWNGSGATSWTQMDGGLYGFSNGSVNDMRIDPDEATHVFAVTGGYGGNSVWELVGGTWQNRSGNIPQDIGINAIFVDWTLRGTPALIVGTERGVYGSTDGGSNWSPFMQGFPNTAVVDLQGLRRVARQGTRLEEHILLTAATYGRGAWAMLVPTGLVSGV